VVDECRKQSVPGKTRVLIDWLIWMFSQAEVLLLGQLRHKNSGEIVIGYCYEAEHRMLVY
jgi:hypothetical protein